MIRETLAKERPDVVVLALWTNLHLPVFRACVDAGDVRAAAAALAKSAAAQIPPNASAATIASALLVLGLHALGVRGVRINVASSRTLAVRVQMSR